PDESPRIDPVLLAQRLPSARETRLGEMMDAVRRGRRALAQHLLEGLLVLGVELTLLVVRAGRERFADPVADAALGDVLERAEDALRRAQLLVEIVLPHPAYVGLRRCGLERDAHARPVGEELRELVDLRVALAGEDVAAGVEGARPRRRLHLVAREDRPDELERGRHR